MEDMSKRLVEAMFTHDPELKKAAEEAGLFKDIEKHEAAQTSGNQEISRESTGVSAKVDGGKTGEKTVEGKADVPDSKKSEEIDSKTAQKHEDEKDEDSMVNENADFSDDEPLDIEVNEDLTKPHFERCYARICRKLKEREQSLPTGDEFRSLTDDVERYKFVRNMDVMSEVRDLGKNHESKDYEAALKRRETGNGMFKKKYYADAHELYTQSILLFPKELDNEQKTELAKSYANRATAACHMNEYRACLVDVKRAFDLGYPLNLKHKLYEKQGKCFKHLKDYDKSVEALRNAIQNIESQDMTKEKKNNLVSDLKKQLSNCESLAKDAGSDPQSEPPVHVPRLNKSTHPTLLSCSSLIDVVFDDVKGRHGVAKQDINVGDVIVVEKPYASVVLPPFYDTHCYRCFKRLKSPVACDYCITARFCDTECRDKAWKEFHHLECGMLHYVDSTDNCWGHLAYRILIKLGYKKLVQFKTFLSTAQDVKWKEYGAHGESINSDDYKCVHNLLTHAEDRNGADLFYRAVKAAYLLKILQKKKFFPQKTPEDVLDFAGGLLLSNLQLCPCNAHEVSELQVYKTDLQRTKTAEIGAGLYPTLSLFNHSCDPNVVRYFYGDLCVTRAIHHIRKGDEIVDNYGTLYPTQKLGERKLHLLGQYFFECACKPCVQDWPMYKDLPEGEEAPPVLKCEKCGEALMPEEDQGLEEWPCSSCQHKHNILTRMAALDQSHDRFAVAIEAVLKGDRSAVRSLEGHLDLMDRLLYLPWKMFNNAQEALKHNYGVAANCFSIA